MGDVLQLGPGAIPIGRAIDSQGVTLTPPCYPALLCWVAGGDLSDDRFPDLSPSTRPGNRGKCACAHDLPLVSPNPTSRKVSRGASTVGPLRTGIARVNKVVLHAHAFRLWLLQPRRWRYSYRLVAAPPHSRQSSGAPSIWAGLSLGLAASRLEVLWVLGQAESRDWREASTGEASIR